MAYYVPLGLRGLVMWIGTVLIGLLGAIVYFLASRRRGLAGAIPQPLVIALPD